MRNKDQIVFNQWGNCLTRKASRIIAIFMILGVMFSCTVADPHDGLRVPTSFVASSISTNTVTLSWGWNPDYDVTNYYILSNQTAGENLATIEANSGESENHYTVTNLKPNTNYTFYLKACGDWGCSTDSSLKVTTRPDPPENFNFVSNENTSTSLSFTWDAPTVNGASHYKLYQGNGVVEEKITSTEQSVDGLNPGTEYIFGLVACNVNNLCSTTNEQTFKTPPDVVKALMVKETNSTEVTISWVKPSETTSYVVSKQEGSGAIEEIANPPSADDSEFTIDSLTPNTDYTFYLKACGDLGCSDNSSVKATTRPDPPKGFVSVEAENTSTSLSFAWEAPPLGGADHYMLYTNNIAIPGKITDTEQSVDGLNPGTEYTFGLVACNVNNLCSTTNEQTFKTPPDVVTDLVIKGDPGSTEVTISWVKPSKTTSYVVSKQEDGRAIEEIAGPPSAGDSEFTIDGLTPNTDYTFYLKACGGLGCSDNSSVKATTRPDSPKNFNFVRDENTPTSLSFAWDAPTGGAEYYTLYRDSGVGEKITGTKQDASGLEPGTKYTFDLVACNKNNLCSATNSLTVTTPPDVVTGLEIKETNSTEVTISWMEPLTTTSYVVSKRKAGETTFVKVDNSPSAGDSEFKIQNLEPETSYTFSLQACNAAGCSVATTVNGRTVKIKYPPANAPGNLRHTRVASTAVELEWDAVEEATYYPVLYKTGSGPEVSNSVSNASKATTVALIANTEYTFSVKACNDKGCFDQVSSTNITTAPEAPENLKAGTITVNSIDLSWDTVIGAVSYIVYTNSSDSLVPIATNTGTTHTAAGLTANTPYTFSVKACNDFGCSLEAKVEVTTTPEAPGGLTHETVTSTTVDLKWGTVTGANSYIVSRDGGAIATNTGNPAATTYSVAELTANTPYTFSVKACNDSGCSENTDLTLTTAPDTPQGFSSETVTSTNVGLKWDTVTGASKYIVYRDGNAIITNTGNSPATMYTATGLTASTGYKFSVKACNKYGCSENSSDLTLTTAPDTPQNLAVDTITMNSISLSWDAVTEASNYIIYRDGDAIATNEGPNPNTTYTASGLNAGTEYTFTVKACISNRCSDPASIKASTLAFPKFYTIRYSNMDSTTPATSTPVIVRSENCNLEALTAEGKVVYSISALTDGSQAVLPTIDSTGVVNNNGNASPGTYRVTVTVDTAPTCNTNVLVYNTITLADKDVLTKHLFGNSSGVALHGDTGNYNYIDTSEVTSFQKLFNGKNKFNGDISGWDTSQVIDMSGMFYLARAFNQPLNNWNTSKVTDMTGMFNNAINFNQPLSNWETSQVESMNSMFREAHAFNQSLNNWETSKVTNMYYMFRKAKVFNQLLNNWDTSQVESMQNMFREAHAFNQPLSNWKTSNVTDMRNMFNSADSFDQPLNNWDTSKVKSMSAMFHDAINFNQPLSNWNTSQVINMSDMFNNAQKFDQDLSGWSVTKVNGHTNVFEGSAMQGKKDKYPDSTWKP